MFPGQNKWAVLSWLILLALASPLVAAEDRALNLRTNDVVAFVGGTDVATARLTGHFETLLAVKFPGARFRNLGWEGDTVFAQPRDVGFPPLADQIKRVGATVIFLQFGRAEALEGRKSAADFSTAYDRLIAGCLNQTPRLVLVTPAPFEKGEAPLPDLSLHNPALAAHAQVIRDIARRRDLPLVDLFSELGGAAHQEPRLTDNGLELTSRGHAHVAATFARQLGFGDVAARAGDVSASGAWSNSDLENLRTLALEKNRLWFNYWRPQNWAFLGGDRISQPSSRDHRDPKVRWFPAEMERYVPLIQVQEVEMERAAAAIRGGGK